MKNKLMIFIPDNEIDSVRMQLQDFSITEAGSVDKVVEKVSNGERPDILIVDSRDSDEIINRLKQAEIEIPVIILTEIHVNRDKMARDSYYLRNVSISYKPGKTSNKMLKYLVEELTCSKKVG